MLLNGTKVRFTEVAAPLTAAQIRARRAALLGLAVLALVIAAFSVGLFIGVHSA
jgi:hypothetical protein